MISKAEIRSIAELQQRRKRKELGLFVAEGDKVVDELLISKIEIENVFVSETHPRAGHGGFIQVSSKDMARMSGQSTPPGILAVAHIPKNQCLGPGSGYSLYLDGLADPGNMGTILRTAEWFGVREIILSPDCTDPYGPKVVQSAMGSLFRQSINYVHHLEVIRAYKGRNVPIVATALHGTPLSQWKVPRSALLVIGSESHGASEAMLEASSELITISKASSAPTESLNAGVATAIVLHHVTSTNK